MLGSNFQSFWKSFSIPQCASPWLGYPKYFWTFPPIFYLLFLGQCSFAFAPAFLTFCLFHSAPRLIWTHHSVVFFDGLLPSFVVWWIEFRASHMLGKYFTTEHHSVFQKQTCPGIPAVCRVNSRPLRWQHSLYSVWVEARPPIPPSACGLSERAPEEAHRSACSALLTWNLNMHKPAARWCNPIQFSQIISRVEMFPNHSWKTHVVLFCMKFSK